jgi:hypothetical protein
MINTWIDLIWYLAQGHVNKRILFIQTGRVSPKIRFDGYLIGHRKPDFFKVGLLTEESYTDIGFKPLPGSPFSLLCPHMPLKMYVYFLRSSVVSSLPLSPIKSWTML